MDFLGIGLPEFIVILILALLVIGPRDLPQWAGRLAKFIRDLRMMSEGFTVEWQREVNAASRLDELHALKQELSAAQQALQETKQSIGAIGRDLLNPNVPASRPTPPPSSVTTAADAHPVE